MVILHNTRYCGMPDLKWRNLEFYCAIFYSVLQYEKSYDIIEKEKKEQPGKVTLFKI